MNFDKALNIPRNMEHRKKYQMIIRAIGFEDVKQCIPFSEDEIKEAYNADPFFNNLPVRKWDLAAGFNTRRCEEMCVFVGSRLTHLYWQKCRVNTFSCSTGVCILKECARLIAEGE